MFARASDAHIGRRDYNIIVYMSILKYIHLRV